MCPDGKRDQARVGPSCPEFWGDLNRDCFFVLREAILCLGA